LTEYRAGVKPGTMFPRVEVAPPASPAVDSVAKDNEQEKPIEETENEPVEEAPRPIDEVLVYVHMHTLREYLQFEFAHSLTQLSSYLDAYSFGDQTLTCWLLSWQPIAAI